MPVYDANGVTPKPQSESEQQWDGHACSLCRLVVPAGTGIKECSFEGCPEVRRYLASLTLLP